MSQTNKTVTVVTQATKAMVKSAQDLAKTAGSLSALAEASEGLTSEIELKSAELASIEARTADALRKAKAELSIKVLENEEGVLGSMLANRGLVSIASNTLEDLRADLQNAQNDNDDAINAAVGKAKGMAESKAKSEAREAELGFQVEAAQLKAQNENLADKNSTLVAQVADMKDMLTAEREARVSMSANQAQPTINVSSAK